ncbi:MAG: type II toxin-antitoxin system VapC family toxin [bacterium]
MKYLLDTNICIYLIKQRPAPVLDHLQRCKPGDIGLSAITVSELEYGVCKSARPQENRLALAEFLAPLEVLMFDDHAAAKYGKIRAELERQGRPIGAMDLLIAAHALSRHLALVTNNEREFLRIPDLKVVNWVD